VVSGGAPRYRDQVNRSGLRDPRASRESHGPRGQQRLGLENPVHRSPTRPDTPTRFHAIDGAVSPNASVTLRRIFGKDIDRLTVLRDAGQHHLARIRRLPCDEVLQSIPDDGRRKFKFK